MAEFITLDSYLAKIQVELKGTKEQLKDIPPEVRLEFAVDILQIIAEDIDEGTIDGFGSRVFVPRAIEKTFTDKKLKFTLSEGDDAEKGYSMKEPK